VPLLQENACPFGVGTAHYVRRQGSAGIPPHADAGSPVGTKGSGIGACAQLQNGDAFWRLHDSLFENQDKITADNVSQKVNDLASQIETLNTRDFRDCLRRQTSLGMVLRDRQLGTLVGVKGTPTLFINGEPLTGLPDAAELHRRLEDAVGQAPRHVAAEN